MANVRIVFNTVDNLRATANPDGIGRLWMRLPTAPWPKSILLWQDGRVVEKTNPTDYDLGTTMANDQAVPVNPDPPDAFYLGGHDYIIDDASWQAIALAAAGITLADAANVYPDVYTPTY